jgi:ferredoxin
VPRGLEPHAKRAVAACPTLALIAQGVSSPTGERR